MKTTLMLTFSIVLGLAAALSAAVPQINQKAIDDVRAGRCKVARAAWWGFQPEESTKALQAAINSGAKKVIVEKMDGPWIVDQIKLAGNQEIVFKEGVVVEAKKGAFHGKSDSLMSASNKSNIKLTGYGATLQMRRADYDNRKEYSKAEWRTILDFHACTNVTVAGLTLAESGGDGIYLGAGGDGTPCKDFVIKDVTCDRNYRQGISVISAENLVIQRCVLKNTAGTSPAAGIDFEPNCPCERLVNCVMRDCLIANNQGYGIQIYACAFDATTTPMSVRIEHCVTQGKNARSMGVFTSCGPKGPVRGTVDVVGCRFEDSRRAGITIGCNSIRGVKVHFVNCRLADASQEPTHVAPIVFESRPGDLDDVGNAEFTDFTLKETTNRPLVSFHSASKRNLGGLSGALKVERNEKQSEIVLDQAFIDKVAPVKPAAKKPAK